MTSIRPFARPNTDLQSRSFSQPHKYRPPTPKMPSRTLAEENMSAFMTGRRKVEEFPSEINKPQRIELPVYFNTPRRYTLPRGRGSSTERPARLPVSNLQSDKKVSVMRRLKDYQMLAFACKRSGKTRDQGRAHYSIGVLLDNVGEFDKAIKAYQQFLTVCKSIGDTHGEALAYNCIGVDYHKMAEMAPGNKALWQEAINYHTKHKEIADVPGKFLAHVNLGIIYSALGEAERAAINHQFALRYAVHLESRAGQSVALGNLGLIGTNTVSGDSSKLKMFVERYLTLSHEQRNRKGESGAYFQLGNISLSIGDYDSSTKNYYRAMKIAEEIGDKDLLNAAKCSFGVANANLKMEDHMKGILERVEHQEEEEDA